MKKNISRVGIVGMGRLGQSLAQGWLRAGLKVEGTCSRAARARAVRQHLKIPCDTDNARLVRSCHTLVLAVKPYHLEALCREIAPELTPRHTLISVAAAFPLNDLRKHLPTHAIVRAMPNTSVQVGSGITLLSTSTQLPRTRHNAVSELFSHLGFCHWMSERRLDLATVASGCAPAFVYELMSHFAHAGQELGLPAVLARDLAREVFLGCAQLANQSQLSPEQLRDQVATPGGMTEAGLSTIVNSSIYEKIFEAFVRSHKKGRSFTPKKKRAP